MKRMIAVLLAACLLLTGCAAPQDVAKAETEPWTAEEVGLPRPRWHQESPEPLGGCGLPSAWSQEQEDLFFPIPGPRGPGGRGSALWTPGPSWHVQNRMRS